MDKKKTFWPYGILLSLFAIVLACVATIIFASQYPVYEDDFYFDSYQNVENNFNQIQRSQQKFNELFSVNLDLNSSIGKKKRKIYHLDENATKVRFYIKSLKEGISPLNLKAELLLTRPHTSEQDLKLETKIVQDKGYYAEATLPTLSKGRWQLKLKLDNQNEIGFFAYELSR